MDNRVLLVENNNIISKPLDIANTFNKYFSTITDTLDIQEWNSNYQGDPSKPITNIIFKYKEHPSVVAIQNENINSNFSFRHVELELELFFA